MLKGFVFRYIQSEYMRSIFMSWIRYVGFISAFDIDKREFMLSRVLNDCVSQPWLIGWSPAKFCILQYNIIDWLNI